MKQHSHRLVKKLTSSACRATRYGQRLRTVLGAALGALVHQCHDSSGFGVSGWGVPWIST
jgi:hypothetical protein